MEPAPLPNRGTQEEYRHKNRLQEFSQRALLPLPVYQIFNEGSQHLPQFRSSVIVDGATFVSPCTFIRRREAEQYVAKFALESILNKIKQEGIPLIHNDTTFCKTILHEYAAKMKMELPTYTTSQSEGLLPTFITSVVFGGKTYIGGASRSKREAEQSGARTVIEWILGQSDTSIFMAALIKSKSKLFNAIPRGGGSIVPNDNHMPLKVTVDNYLGDVAASGKDMCIGLIVPQPQPQPQPQLQDNIAPTNGKLPETPKEQLICEVCSGSIGGMINVSTLQKNNQTEGSTGGPFNHIPNDSCIEPVIQVKTEVPSEDPAILPGHMHNPNPASGGKRSQKKNKRASDAKKLRTNE